MRFTVPRLSNAEETQASQDDAAVMAAIKAREKAAMQTAAPSPKRLGGGLTHMQAALRREMEMDQAAAAAAAAATQCCRWRSRSSSTRTTPCISETSRPTR